MNPGRDKDGRGVNDSLFFFFFLDLDLSFFLFFLIVGFRLFNA